jgi:hypothetical protein
LSPAFAELSIEPIDSSLDGAKTLSHLCIRAITAQNGTPASVTLIPSQLEKRTYVLIELSAMTKTRW